MNLNVPVAMGHDVVAGAGLRFGGRGQLVLFALRGDVVDVDFDFVLLAPLVADFVRALLAPGTQWSQQPSASLPAAWAPWSAGGAAKTEAVATPASAKFVDTVSAADIETSPWLDQRGPGFKLGGAKHTPNAPPSRVRRRNSRSNRGPAAARQNQWRVFGSIQPAVSAPRHRGGECRQGGGQGQARLVLQ